MTESNIPKYWRVTPPISATPHFKHFGLLASTDLAARIQEARPEFADASMLMDELRQLVRTRRP